MSERVFVSGEDGLLPRSIIDLLRQRGDVILNDELPKTWQPPSDILHQVGALRPREKEVDVLDPAILGLIREARPSLVIHAAAMVGTDKCVLNEGLAWRCNVETTFNMAVLARDAGARLIYLSSSASYDPEVPRPYSVAWDDKFPPRPRTIYGQTKYLGEHVCREVFGFRKLLIVRPSFVYGGIRDTSSTIIRIAKAVLFDGQPASVLLDFQYLKDFMHVDDFAGVMLGLIRVGAEGSYDVVRGDPRAFGDALWTLMDLLGKDRVQAKMDWHPEGDYMRDHYADGRAAWIVSGYKPGISLAEGLKWAVRELETLKGRWQMYA